MTDPCPDGYIGLCFSGEGLRNAQKLARYLADVRTWMRLTWAACGPETEGEDHD